MNDDDSDDGNTKGDALGDIAARGDGGDGNTILLVFPFQSSVDVERLRILDHDNKSMGQSVGGES